MTKKPKNPLDKPSPIWYNTSIEKKNKLLLLSPSLTLLGTMIGFGATPTTRKLF